MSEEIEKEQNPSREIPGMFEGPMLPLIVRLAVPMLFGMLVQLLYNVTDTFFVSRIDLSDPSIVGGTGLIFPLIFFAMAIANGLMVGTSSLVARAIGGRKWDVLSRTAESGIVISILGGLIIFVPVMLFAEPMVRAMGAEGDYLTHGLDYLEVINWVVIPMMLGQVLLGILQGEGKMKYVMHTMMIGTLGNILLDPIFIFEKGQFGIGWFGMGIKGAALATVIAQTIAILYLISVFIRKKSSVPISRKISNIRGSIMLEVLRVGIPQTLSQVMLSLSFVVFNKIAMSVDPQAMTAFSLTGRMDNAVLMPLFALGSAMVTIVGQNSARGNWERSGYAWRTGYTTGVAAVLFSATIMVIFAPRIYPFFTDVNQVIQYAVGQTRTLEYTFIGVAFTILGSSVFQALGRPLPGLFIMAMRLFLFSVPFVLLMVYVFDLGVPGIWYGVGSSNLITAVFSFFWINKTIKILARDHKTIDLAAAESI